MEYVVVTGAYGGMGKACVKNLVNAGYGVFALDRVVEQETESVFPIQVDVTDEQSAIDAYKIVAQKCESISAIIHFAGIYVLGSMVEMQEEKFLRAFNVNVFGAYRINKAFLPLLKQGAKIVITTSELAPLDPLPFTGVYAVTKSALDKYAYSLRMEVQLLGISVAVIRAGAVDTGLLGVSTSELDNFCDQTALYTPNADRFKKIVNDVEAKKVSPDKIAQVVCKILRAKKPKYIYNLNRNPLLLLLNILPQRMQTFAIKKVLTSKSKKK